jgi:membrane protease YdiL (CAAX protease family)
LSALPTPAPAARSSQGRPAIRSPLVRAAVAGSLLAVAIGARWAATVGGSANGLAIGAAFGTVLVVGSISSGWQPPSVSHRHAALQGAIGLAGGCVLVGLALAARWPGPWIPFHPSDALLPWAAVTILVATGEELVLRGALFDSLDSAWGPAAALVLTSFAFALLHVPLYGWHVVPLDLGVGIFLGGLRLSSGGVVAPAVTHAVADLATWWI